jgi:hypothetical protein
LAVASKAPVMLAGADRSILLRGFGVWRGVDGMMVAVGRLYAGQFGVRNQGNKQENKKAYSRITRIMPRIARKTKK